VPSVRAPQAAPLVWIRSDNYIRAGAFCEVSQPEHPMQHTLQHLFWLSSAGAAGTLCRYGLQGLVQRLSDRPFPYGTLAVNALGCFLFGLVWALAEERLVIRPETRVILLVGFMGAFTTFSTFAFETGSFLRDSQWAMAAANVAAQNVLGMLCLFAGLAVSRWL
jgi:CrcB protein